MAKSIEMLVGVKAKTSKPKIDNFISVSKKPCFFEWHWINLCSNSNSNSNRSGSFEYKIITLRLKTGCKHFQTEEWTAKIFLRSLWKNVWASTPPHHIYIKLIPATSYRKSELKFSETSVWWMANLRNTNMNLKKKNVQLNWVIWLSWLVK